MKYLNRADAGRHLAARLRNYIGQPRGTYTAIFPVAAK